MVDLSDPLSKLRVACATCTGIAIFTTVFRSYVRIHKSELWVDDALAILSMFTLITQLVAVFINPNMGNGVVRYYLIDNMFFAAIWSARLSILFSIIRITRSLRPHRSLFYIAAAFVFAWAFLTAQIYWECETHTAWKHTAAPQCKLNNAVAICQLITDIISDSILLLIPIRMLIAIQEKRLRYRLIMIFGTCVITTVVSFVHAAYLFEVKEGPILIAGVVENAVSLVVCNIPITVTAILKLQQGSGVLTKPPLSHDIDFRTLNSTVQPIDTMTSVDV